jgi:ornithine decarboxylase
MFFQDFLTKFLSNQPNPDQFLSEIFEKVKSGEDLRLINFNLVKENYLDFKKYFPFADVYAAVKAISAQGMIRLLDSLGSNFEIATIEELILCLNQDVSPDQIIFTHPAKDQVEIEGAFNLGVQNFVSDSIEDLNLLARYAPGANILIRIKAINPSKENDEITGFDLRFGATKDESASLVLKAFDLGLKVDGICFHIGTQEENVKNWDASIKKASEIFHELDSLGIRLNTLNIGGGFPSRYKQEIPHLEEYGQSIYSSIAKYFDKNLPNKIIIEPGRGLAAMAGITIGRVIQVKKQDKKSIVTLSTGKFSAGLFSVGNGFHFFRSNHSLLSDLELVDADVYGKACASFDKPKDGAFKIPAELKSGDIVVITGTGAYSGEMSNSWCSKTKPRDVFL